MTEPQAQPDPQPDPQAQPETTHTATPQDTVQRKPRVRWTIPGAIVLVLLLCFGGCGALPATTSGEEPSDGKAAASAAPQAHSTTSAPTTAAAPTTAPATTSPPVLAYETPTKSDFKLKVKVLKKQCFGSAGCNITYRIGVTYTGDGDLDPSKTYEVTYQVKGAEDPIINTFEVTGDSASVQEEEMASTKRSSDKLTAVVTDVCEF
ncbi:hypothetical protein GA0070609_2878 [Micromonospora echinaurantiaca]|uniref:Uncharacterized protein n=1 Tax=Micromonospora echinaurantiaca TaxID=47857 RepID=A0A1C5I7F4_9ACTN|nr:hypothetical protein [Micromonospora echinaurantiaca]SCG53841.1 hypothetical protein GA0070609_2878 [Micromonospora echinaurantiaca]